MRRLAVLFIGSLMAFGAYAQPVPPSPTPMPGGPPGAAGPQGATGANMVPSNRPMVKEIGFDGRGKLLDAKNAKQRWVPLPENFDLAEAQRMNPKAPTAADIDPITGTLKSDKMTTTQVASIDPAKPAVGSPPAPQPAPARTATATTSTKKDLRSDRTLKGDDSREKKAASSDQPQMPPLPPVNSAAMSASVGGNSLPTMPGR